MDSKVGENLEGYDLTEAQVIKYFKEKIGGGSGWGRQQKQVPKRVQMRPEWENISWN